MRIFSNAKTGKILSVLYCYVFIDLLSRTYQLLYFFGEKNSREQNECIVFACDVCLQGLFVAQKYCILVNSDSTGDKMSKIRFGR